MKHALILMTALPPTIGHKALINFAYQFMVEKHHFHDEFRLHVLINSRSFEPLSGKERLQAFQNEFINNHLVKFYLCENDDVPQNPEDHPNFWFLWKNLITKYTDGIQFFDYVFASEKYGIKLAETLDAKFIPYDMNREIIKVSGTSVRSNTILRFNKMLPLIKNKYQRVVTFFGQESVGKTTMTNKVFGDDEGVGVTRIPEYARPYLETLGSEVTDEKMLDIVYGQNAIQNLARRNLDNPFIFQDTDLLSTLGYYKLWKGSWPKECEKLFKRSKSDIYILMNDNIPFEPDQLRYGGDKRESTMWFWKDLLEDFGCKYYEVKETNLEKQIDEIENVLYDLFYENCKLREFTRE